MARLLDRLDDSFDVKGLYRAQIDDFGFDTVLLLELLSGDKRLANTARECDNGKVFARALDLGFAELDFVS